MKGPYTNNGEKIIQGCIKNGCHYLDISGETDFVQQTSKYDQQAKDYKTILINSCGFDSIPCKNSILKLNSRLGSFLYLNAVPRRRKKKH